MAAWITRAKITNDLTRLIDSGCDLKQVLMCKDLTISIRNEVPELIEFFFNEKNGEKQLNELFDYALTTKLNNNEDDYKNYNKPAATVLSSVCRSLQNKLNDNSELKNRLLNFFNDCDGDEENKPYRNPILAGHFQRIMETYNRFSGKKFVSEFNGIYKVLLDNLDLNAYYLLFVNLSIESLKGVAGAEKSASDMFDDIARIIQESKPEKQLNIINALMDIIKQSTEPPDTMCRNSLIESLFDIASKSSENILLFTNSFKLIKKLFEIDESINQDETSEKKENHKKLVDNLYKKCFCSKGLKYDRLSSDYPLKYWMLSGFAILYSADNFRPMDFMLPVFFNHTFVNTDFCLGFLNGIKEMDKEKRIDFITRNELLNKIMGRVKPFPLGNETIDESETLLFNDEDFLILNFPSNSGQASGKPDVNGFILELAILLTGKDGYVRCDATRSKEWEEFCLNTLFRHINYEYAIDKEVHNKMDDDEDDEDDSN